MGSFLGKIAQSIATGLNGGYPVNYTPLSTTVEDYTKHKIFTSQGLASIDKQKELLTKLTSYGIAGSPEKDSIPDGSPRISLKNNISDQSYIRFFDNVKNGELSGAFLNILNLYQTNPANAYLWYANVLPKTVDGKEQKQGAYLSISSQRSIFNPYYAVKANGFSTNKPLLDVEHESNKNNPNPFKDTSDCSIAALLDTDLNPNGVSFFALADFMYCKDLGKVANNHMITLRRFATPVGDNIFMSDKGKGENLWENYPDIGRMITWFGTDDNKLSDILKMRFNATWKPMDAKIEEVENKGEQGILGMIANTLNPMYNEAQGKGLTGTNNLISAIGATINIGPLNLGQNGQYEGHKALTNYDDHKIYTPKDTIQSNHYYEGKLVFENEFTLNFSYKLRSYGTMNQKAVMLDLINNILRVTYTKGTFWGGSVHWVGPPGNNSFMKKADAFINNTFDTLGGVIKMMLSGGDSWQSVLGALSDAGSNLISTISEAGKNIIEDPKAELNKAAAAIVELKGVEAIKGQLKNALGRPALYAIQSFVSGEDLGLWHVTIGNPRNPIAVMGNLIITNTELSFGDTPLGLDDFPTELKVAVTLKHCKPRDMIGIGQMFTKGETGLGTEIGQTGIMNFHSRFPDPGNPSSPIRKHFNADKDVTTIRGLKEIFGTTYVGKITRNADEIS